MQAMTSPCRTFNKTVLLAILIIMPGEASAPDICRVIRTGIKPPGWVVMEYSWYKPLFQSRESAAANDADDTVGYILQLQS